MLAFIPLFWVVHFLFLFLLRQKRKRKQNQKRKKSGARIELVKFQCANLLVITTANFLPKLNNLYAGITEPFRLNHRPLADTNRRFVIKNPCMCILEQNTRTCFLWHTVSFAPKEMVWKKYLFLFIFSFFSLCAKKESGFCAE